MANLVLVQSVYFQPKDKEPVGLDWGFAREVGDEQLYQREFSVGSTKIKLDPGWVEHVGWFGIMHVPTRYQVNPELVQSAKDRQRVVRLFFEGMPLTELLPGGSFMMMTDKLQKFTVDCSEGSANCKVVVVAAKREAADG